MSESHSTADEPTPAGSSPAWAQLSGHPAPDQTAYARVGAGPEAGTPAAPLGAPSVPPVPRSSVSPHDQMPPQDQPISWMEVSLDEDGAPAGPSHPPARAHHRPGLVAVAAIGAGALLIGGFAAGRVLNGSSGTALSSQQAAAGQAAPAGPGQQGGRQLQGRQGGAVGGGAGGTAAGTMTVGRLTAVTGSTLTLTGRDGQPFTVAVGSATTVDGTAGGDVSGLAVGDVVFVRGTQAADGSWTASAVNSAAAGARGGLGRDPDDDAATGQGTTTDQSGGTTT